MSQKNQIFVGWDIGGAHLKIALMDSHSGLYEVQQFSTPIWKGLRYLENQIDWIKSNVLAKYSVAEYVHAITMTAELCDYFDSREDGVIQISDLITESLSDQELFFYAAEKGFVVNENIQTVLTQLASSNWHATASFMATRYDEGLLVDMGSTTTDIIPFKNRKLINAGCSDNERLNSGELIYTGIVRTPVMALSGYVEYDEKKYGLMAEHFATTSDIYRVLEMLDEQADQYETADGREKTKQASILRLRRMIGLDSADTEMDKANTFQMASSLFKIQTDKIKSAAISLIEKNLLGQELIIIRAGCGVDILSEAFTSFMFKHISFDSIITNNNVQTYAANTCASAISVAELLRLKYAD